MLNSFSQFAKRIIRSRLGWTFLALHLFFVFIAFGEKRPQSDQATYAEFQRATWDYILIAGRGIHIGVESDLMKLLFALDAPSLVVGLLILEGLSLFYSNMPVIITSWIDAGLLLFLTSVQWLSIGYIIQQLRILEGIHSTDWFQRIRNITSWVVLPVSLMFLITQNVLVSINPQGYGPWKDSVPQPVYYGELIAARNLLLLIAFVTGLIGLPNRKAIVGLGLTMVYFGFVYWRFYNY